MFTGAAKRAGLPRLKPGAVTFQIFNRFFPLAERLQVEIVLVFVFILLPTLRQGGIEFCLLRLRLLDVLGALPQAFVQLLMLFMQESSRWRSGRDCVCCAIAAATSSADNDRALAGRALSFWRSAARRVV